MFKLIRVGKGEAGAFGVLLHNGVPFAVTIEHTYAPDNSLKIPAGTYHCPRTIFNRGGYPTYMVPVAGHDRILFHIANTETDVDGCVGIAKSFGLFGGIPGIVNSRAGFTEFMLNANDAPAIDVEVRDAY